METLYTFMAGAITFGFSVAALFFFRFWRSTGDGLFAAFAVAFLFLGAGQAMLALMEVAEEERSWLYLVRLAAFLCIILAALYKNRRQS
jgi:hypothetical protein